MSKSHVKSQLYSVLCACRRYKSSLLRVFGFQLQNETKPPSYMFEIRSWVRMNIWAQG